MRLIRAVLPACAVAASFAALGTGSAAAATCYSSTPATVSYSDAVGDGDSGLAPDITTGTASVDAACNVTVSYAIAGQSGMYADDFLSWFIDVDNNLGTGSQSGYRGADYAIGRLGSGFSGLLKYSAATASFETYKTIPSSGSFGAQAALADLDASPGTFTVAGGSSWDGVYGSYFDFAPEPGAAAVPFSVQFSSVAPPVQAQPSVGQPTPAAQESDVTLEPETYCRVPYVKGLTVAKARKRLASAHCRMGTVKRVRSRSFPGRIVRTNPKSGTRLASGAKVRLVVGRSGRTARAADAGDARRVTHLVNLVAEGH
jgi:hypothetical protein